MFELLFFIKEESIFSNKEYVQSTINNFWKKIGGSYKTFHSKFVVFKIVEKILKSVGIF